MMKLFKASSPRVYQFFDYITGIRNSCIYNIFDHVVLTCTNTQLLTGAFTLQKLTSGIQKVFSSTHLKAVT